MTHLPYSYVRAMVFRPTVGFDGRCECYACTAPGGWRGVINAILSVFFG